MHPSMLVAILALSPHATLVPRLEATLPPPFLHALPAAQPEPDFEAGWLVAGTLTGLLAGALVGIGASSGCGSHRGSPAGGAVGALLVIGGSGGLGYLAGTGSTAAKFGMVGFDLTATLVGLGLFASNIGSCYS